MTVTGRTWRGFEHEALVYRDERSFLEGLLPFIAEGVAAGEAVMVALPRERLELVRRELAPNEVTLVDMSEAGRNPATILPLWQAFVTDALAQGRRPRGVGEPVWSGRSDAELVECHHHETLLNLAFAEGPAWRLVCPYDAASLPADVVDRAIATHPLVADDGGRFDNSRYAPRVGDVLLDPLPEPPETAWRLRFDREGLRDVRALARDFAAKHARDGDQLDDVVLALTELATNSVRYGGGAGTLELWSEDDSFVCQVSDEGQLFDPLVGRRAPDRDVASGRGLWLVNHLCDLAQLRSGPAGTIVRLRWRTTAPARPDRAEAS